jgi:hypothetical protein
MSAQVVQRIEVSCWLNFSTALSLSGDHGARQSVPPTPFVVTEQSGQRTAGHIGAGFFKRQEADRHGSAMHFLAIPNT